MELYRLAPEPWRLIPGLSVVGVQLLAYHTAGSWLPFLFPHAGRDDLRVSTLRVVAGAFTLSLLAFALALPGLASGRCLALLVLLLALAGIGPAARALSTAVRGLTSSRPTGPAAAAVTGVAMMWILWFLVAHAPIAGDCGRDELYLHLYFPSRYLQGCTLVDVPGEPGSGLYVNGIFPQTTHLLGAIGWALAGHVGSRLVNTTFAGLMWLLAFWIARRHAGARSGLVAVVLLAFWPPGQLVNHFLYQEQFVASAILATLLCTDPGLSIGPGRRAALCGLFVGFAAGCKYEGAAIALCALLTIFFDAVAVRRESLSLGFRSLALSALVAALAASPQYARAAMLTGDPVYPFSRPGIATASQTEWANVETWMAGSRHYGRGHGTGLAAFLALPWNLAMNGHAFNFWGTGWPLPLAFLPVLAIVGLPRGARTLALFVSLHTVVWFETSQESRRLLASAAGVSIVVAVTLDRLSRRSAVLGLAAWLAAATSVALGSFVARRELAAEIDVALGRTTTDAFVETATPQRPLYLAVDRLVPPAESVWMVGLNNLGFPDFAPLLVSRPVAFAVDVAAVVRVPARRGRPVFVLCRPSQADALRGFPGVSVATLSRHRAGCLVRLGPGP